MNGISVIANKEEPIMLSKNFQTVLQSKIVITIEGHQIPQ